MTELLSKIFIKDRDNVNSQKVRSSYINLTSITGILLNILLFAGKLVFGILANSIAIIADAFNNISDAGSSVVTWIGFRMSNKHVDEEHPFGHGRMEYITGFIVDMLIIFVGYELLTGSVEKIFNPVDQKASIFTYVMLGASVFVKLWLFLFYRKIGNKINAEPLRASSIDSISDCAATSIVLVSLILSSTLGWNIDGYVGVVVAIFILIAGVRAAKGTIDLLLGAPPSKEYIEELTEFIKKYKIVVGIHDLMVHDYGEGRKFISFHAEVPSDFDINIAHEEIDCLERDMHKKFGAIVTVHLDPIDVNDENVRNMREFAERCVKETDERFSIHDFRMTKGERLTNLIFDLVIPVDYDGKEEDAAKEVAKRIKEKDPNCFAVIKPEHLFC